MFAITAIFGQPMGPGGYRFGDYWRLGIVVMAIFFAASVLLVPVFWPF